MALILLVVMGLVTGWIASVLTRVEQRREVLTLMGIGLVASIAGGLMSNSGTFLGSLSWLATGVALVSSAAALAAYRYYLNRSGA